MQSPDGITVSGNMAIAAAAVGRRQDAMVFLHEAGISDDEAAVVDKVEVTILCILYIYIYCNYIYVIN